jgi:hypothetical protein
VDTVVIEMNQKDDLLEDTELLEKVRIELKIPASPLNAICEEQEESQEHPHHWSEQRSQNHHYRSFPFLCIQNNTTLE